MSLTDLKKSRFYRVSVFKAVQGDISETVSDFFSHLSEAIVTRETYFNML